MSKKEETHGKKEWRGRYEGRSKSVEYVKGKFAGAGRNGTVPVFFRGNEAKTWPTIESNGRGRL